MSVKKALGIDSYFVDQIEKRKNLIKNLNKNRKNDEQLIDKIKENYKK